MAFREQYVLTKLDDFRGRVTLAMVLTAINVQGTALSDPVTAQENRRSVYARELLNEDRKSVV